MRAFSCVLPQWLGPGDSSMVLEWNTVLDNEGTNLLLELPAAAVEGDGTLTNAGRITIGGYLPVDLAVSLVSDDTNEVTIPPVVAIPNGCGGPAIFVVELPH